MSSKEHRIDDRLFRQRARLFDLSLDLQSVMGFDGYLVQTNLALRNLLGFSDEELKTTPFMDFLHPEDFQRAAVELSQLMAGNDALHFEARIRCKDESYRWISWNATVSHNEEVIYAVGRDMTDVRKDREELHRALEITRRVVQSSVDGILAFDTSYCYTLWNPAMESIAGLRESEVIGRHAFELFPFLVDVGHDRFFAAALQGETTLAPDTPYSVPETGRTGWFASVYSPLYGDSGEVVGGLGIIRDVSDRKQLEESKQKFIANAAHELRTPISVLGGFADLLANHRDQLDDETAQQAVMTIERQVVRMRILINDLLDFSRLERSGEEIPCEPVSVDEAVDRALALNPPPEGKSVEVNVAEHLIVLSEPSRLEQVVINLLGNAYKYGGENITVEALAVDEAWAEVAVADDGPGVPSDEQIRLFEPFRRGSSGAGVEGSGLGLAIVQTIVEACGGSARYDWDVPGARFVVRLARPE